MNLQHFDLWQISTNAHIEYRSISLSQSPRKWRKYIELSEVQYNLNMTSPQYDVHVQFLQDIYFCSTCVVKLFLLKTG